MTRTVHVVPHTHWDREWYAPFQIFRLRLVDLLDDLLPRMEADPSYGHFLLDGQLALVDDYLAVRPDAEETIRRLVGSGRVAVGPWYTLPDEFLVSGETLIRNLQLGLRVGARFGGAMGIGYLPDMFGHIAQMPQILRHFGFEHAVVWRGVPAAIDRSAFWWAAPDGSTVRAEYLPQGYGNGATVPDDAKALVRQVTEFDELWGDLLGDGPILWMNGADHKPPDPWLGRVVAEANEIQFEYEVRVASLTEHLAAAPTEGLPTWDGELRAGARANLLMGVTSNRIDVRQAAARAERALERVAEPVCALFQPAELWPEALFGEAWRHLVHNAAHDSVCACSVDEVCDAVLVRYAEAAHVAEGVTERAVARLGARVAHRGPVIVNPSARARSAIVELRLPVDDAPEGTQALSARAAESVLLEGSPELVVPAVEELGWNHSIQAFTLETTGGVRLVSGRRRGGALITSSVRAALAALDHTGPVRLRVRQQPRVRVLAYAANVPGFGWARWAPGPLTVRPVAAERDAGAVLTNGLVTMSVTEADGTFALNGRGGLGRLLDGGDCGDTYNWCPPARDTVVDGPEKVAVDIVEGGPLRGRVVVRSRYNWPAGCEGLDRRIGEVTHDVVTTYELRAGERIVRVEVRVDNRSRDHRLRAHFPLPNPADGSRAECAFAVVERGLDAEGGPNEPPLPTYPSRRFVQAGGLTVIHDGLLEYELVDIRDGRAHELALTLLRCTGMLSQAPMTTRPLPAGPLTPMEGPQLQRRLTLRYAVAIGDVDPYALADEVLVPLQVTIGGGTELPGRGTRLRVEGAEVSAVRREGGAQVVRVFNPTPEPTDVTIEGRRGWLVDLRGRPLEPFEGHFPLRPWGIATAMLAAD